MPNKLRLLDIALCLCLAAAAQAQPQWRFYLAFEDGTGARDTIWHIWDETATEGWALGQVDHHLGEGRVEMDLSAFNVWLGNWDADSTKTMAYPYTVFPWHGSQEINAFNYTYPITIRWDRSLFHTPFLPDPQAINTALLAAPYFYVFDEPLYAQTFSLLGADSVVVNYYPLAGLFPTYLYINHLDPIGILEADAQPLQFHQADGWLYVQHAQQPLRELRVLDAAGRLVARSTSMESPQRIAMGHAPPGLYILHAITTNNTYHRGKFIKVE